jgi:hypothetical protein
MTDSPERDQHALEPAAPAARERGLPPILGTSARLTPWKPSTVLCAVAPERQRTQQRSPSAAGQWATPADEYFAVTRS